MTHPKLTSDSPTTDIFSLSDQALSDRLQFVEEIGFGNWGSVWLCRPKPTQGSSEHQEPMGKIAAKLVHRSKTKTTAARVRSLWNEMKIVRSFKDDPHPSIIPFHSFIITPSYALITMAFLPTLIPVEVAESKAHDWFRSLLSGIEFLHKRGVVHNDIKPANILLSERHIPVLVDFGFAEKHELKSSHAFHSNLSYGTPEYLSPERARGVMHDTRKSDVWSLGITFFEILVGRTPFEYKEGEEFTTKEDLERYWSRTLRGKWVGTWKFSKPMEKMLRRMMSPNADLRCTASDVMKDQYWHQYDESPAAHRRSASAANTSPSIMFNADVSKLVDMLPPWATRGNTQEKEVGVLKPKVELGRTGKENKVKEVGKTKSQSKLQPKRPPVVANLSPIKGSPTSSPKVNGANDVVSFDTIAGNTAHNANSRKALAVLGARRISVLRDNLTREDLSPSTKDNLPPPPQKERHKKGRVLRDLTGLANGSKSDGTKKTVDFEVREQIEEKRERDRVKDRVKEWEREKERLREIERLEELERERDEELEKAKEEETGGLSENQKDMLSKVPPSVTLSSSDLISPPGQSLSNLTQAMRASIDKGVRLVKSSTPGPISGRKTTNRSLSITGSIAEAPVRQSWEDETLIRQAKSSLPVVRHAVRAEQLAADNRMDRMTIWMKNIEQVVEDACQTFNANAKDRPLPPIPLSPVSTSQIRNNRPRVPRKILAASQIFVNAPEYDNAMSANTATPNDSIAFPKASQRPSSEYPTKSPPRQRRATVSSRSPEPFHINFDIDHGSPSKRKEKCRSQSNLLEQRIAPIAQLELELEQSTKPERSPRLSNVIDKSLFIIPPAGVSAITLSHDSSSELDSLLASPLHVEPYQTRNIVVDPSALDAPSQRRVEGVYDRFLMATSGVKRLGKGYQSDNNGPVVNNVEPPLRTLPSRVFNSTRRMPPPVSSDDPRRAVSVDELGTVPSPQPDTPTSKEEGAAPATLVRRAFKAITGKTVSRRLSRLS